MAAASDQQIQHYVDERVRPSCADIVLWTIRRQNDKDNLDDVYAALNVQNPTWTDTRTTGVAHLATPSEVLAWNAFISDVTAFITSHATWPVIKRLPINPVPSS